LNGTPIRRSQVLDGDRIAIGDCILTFHESLGRERLKGKGLPSLFVASYKIAETLSIALGVGRFKYVWIPMLLGGIVALVLDVAGVRGNVTPELFSVLATTIPTLAIAVFVVVSNGFARLDERGATHPTVKYFQMVGIGLGIGLQTLTGEVLSLVGVAIGSSNRTLALLTASIVVAQVVFLIAFTFYGIPLSMSIRTAPADESHDDATGEDNN
jgi:hypothetical protein